MIRTCLCLMLVVLATATSGQERETDDRDFRVADIQAHLLYEESGRLSGDISDNPTFTAWNTIIGEGSAEENANDLLVTAVVVGPGQHNARAPLLLTAHDGQGRLIATRRIGNMLVEPRTYRSLIIYDAGCMGILKLSAKFGTSERTEEISLDCGE